MIEGRPHADRILVAQLTGEEHAASVRELRALAAGRADLLAEVAGLLDGAADGDLEEGG